MKKILVGVDFSPGSDAAVSQALHLARRAGAELCLLHVGLVVGEPSSIPVWLTGARATYRQAVADQLAEDRAALESLRGRLSGQGCQVSHMVIDGFPDTAIVDAAGRLGADLVVLGSHGRTGVKRLLLGSVAERVVRLAPCDVLIARPGSEPRGGYARILVPTDFSDQAARALDVALQFAAPGAVVDVLHCWQPPVSRLYAGTTLELLESMRREISTQVAAAGEALLAAHPGAGATLQFHEVEASAAHGIQTWLEAHPQDLVVTGSHGRRGVRRFVLGSVAESTVRHSPCSVLVVRGRHGPGP